MRVWDIDPGYLNDKSLLGEHREIHAVHAILTQGKKGYARHPETLRWRRHLNALSARHGIVTAEMALRGFNHHSPLQNTDMPVHWPDTLIDPLWCQFKLLKNKYKDKPRGRIRIPDSCQALWAAHKYSVMARDPAIGRVIGRDVAGSKILFDDLIARLVKTLQQQPAPRRLINALLHMWGYIRQKPDIDVSTLNPAQLIALIRQHAIKEQISYLIHSTALGELAFWGTG